MKVLISFCLLAMFVSISFATETMVFIRHGEKPSDGLGQITCQGLNRALQLPHVLESKFGKPDAIFASNPFEQKPDKGVPYYYIRPLATIEPTAITFGLPVNIAYAFKEVDALIGEITNKKYQNATLFIAWEHHLLVEIVKRLVAKEPSIKVPAWEGEDFDSIYIVKFDHETKRYTFTIDHQNLNDLPKQCPDAKY